MDYFVGIGIPWWLALLLGTLALPFLICFAILRLFYEIWIEGVDRARAER